MIVQKEVEYLKAKQDRIEKMHVLTALQEEKNLLDEAIKYQNKVETMLMSAPANDFGLDLTKLKEISQQQQDQLKVNHAKLLIIGLTTNIIHILYTYIYSPIVAQKGDSNASFESQAIRSASTDHAAATSRLREYAVARSTQSR